MVRARQEIEARIALALIRSCIAAGYFISVDDGSGDEVSNPSQDLMVITRAMMATDEDILFIIEGNGVDRFKVGWIKLVYGNEGYDVIHDYSTSLDEKLFEEATAISDYYAAGEGYSDGSFVLSHILAEQSKERGQGQPRQWTYGDFVHPIEDERHVGRSKIPASLTKGVCDVEWVGKDMTSSDIPLDKLALAYRNSYSICISEFQRERITKALAITLGSFGQLAIPYSDEEGSGDGAFDTERKEVEVLRNMFNDLPEADAKGAPGNLHGFCL